MHHAIKWGCGPRRLGLLLSAAIVGLGAIGCGALARDLPSSAATAPQSPAPRGPGAEEAPDDPVLKSLLDAHNRERAEADLPPLASSPELSAAARIHALEMVALGEITHRGPDGSDPADRVDDQDYPYRRIGENVAAGQTTVDAVMGSWMNSEGHRENILGDFEEMGAARVNDDENLPYWCVVFASPIPALEPSDAARGLAEAINRHRADSGLQPLDIGEELDEVAQAQASAMAGAGSFTPEGFSLVNAINDAGIGYRRLASGAMSGLPRPEDVVEGLLKDEGQRRNLLGDFDRLGAGYAQDGGGTPYWSLIFVDDPEH